MAFPASLMYPLVCMICRIQSPVPPVRTATTTTFVLSKEGILGFWDLMDVYNLNRSLPFGFTKVKHTNTNNFSISQIDESSKITVEVEKKISEPFLASL